MLSLPPPPPLSSLVPSLLLPSFPPMYKCELSAISPTEIIWKKTTQERMSNNFWDLGFANCVCVCVCVCP